MRTLRAWVIRFGNLFDRARRERELTDEIETNLQFHIGDNIRSGMTPEEARRSALLKFGGLDVAKEQVRDRHGIPVIESFARDFTLSIRMLRRNSLFTAVVVISLALGIGANTAIFTLIDAVLIKSLPVRDPDGLVILGDAKGQGVVIGETGSFYAYSYDLYKHLQNTKVFEGLSAVNAASDTRVRLRQGIQAAEPARVKFVSGNYFQVLGVNAGLGRTIADSDDSASAPPVAVISDRYWKDRFHGEASVVGSTLEINGVPVSIIGVAPPGFDGETLQPDPPYLWLPISADRPLFPAFRLVDAPERHWLYLIGRLRQDLSKTQAQIQLTAALQNWLTDQEGSTISAEQRKRISESYIELTPGGSGIRHMQQTYWQVLLLLMGISGTVLLITCTNVANLLLARGAAHRVECSVRHALGASRARLVQQSLTESLMLAGTGGCLALFITPLATNGLLSLFFRGAGYVPRQTSPNLHILAFTLAVSFGVAILFGLLPTIRMNSEVASTMKGVGPGIRNDHITHGRFGWGKTLVVAEVALSLVVITGAGAFGRSLANLSSQRFGFDPGHVLIITVNPYLSNYEYNQLGSLYEQIRSRLSAMPGVRSVSLSSYTPFNGCCWNYSVSVQGYTPKAEENTVSELNRVSPGYFETLGTRVQAGRSFDEHDTPRSLPVAVVNEEFVRRFFQAEDPIGKHFGIGGRRNSGAFQIVGVVENAKYDNPREVPTPMAFLPLLQTRPRERATPGEFETNFIDAIELRSIGNPASIARQAREALADVDPGLLVLGVDTVVEQVNRALSQESVIADLAGFFGLLAVALACVGIYGLLSYMVQRRDGEIGIRMALGADRSTVLRMVIGQAVIQSGVGILIGIPIAFAATRVVANQLFGVCPADPVNYAAAALVMLIFGAIAAFLPAQRASKIDPMAALRHE